MLAYFYKGEFVGMWQDQSSQPGWVDQTAIALGHQKADVEVYFCDPMPNNQSFYFNEDRELVLGEKSTMEIDGEMQTVMNWADPIPLQRFFPAP